MYTWKYFALAAVAGLGYYIYRRFKSTVSYEQYIEKCIEYSKTIKDEEIIVSKVLTAHLSVDKDCIDIYLYKKYEGGKVTRTKMPFSSYPLALCPIKVQEEVKSGEYVVYKF